MRLVRGFLEIEREVDKSGTLWWVRRPQIIKAIHVYLVLGFYVGKTWLKMGQGCISKKMCSKLHRKVRGEWEAYNKNILRKEIPIMFHKRGFLTLQIVQLINYGDFSGSPVVKSLPANAADMGLIREDPTFCSATKPMCHNYWACVLRLRLWDKNSWSPLP